MARRELILSALYPLSLAMAWIAQPLFTAVPALAQPFVRGFLVAAAIVAVMTWVIMPRYTRLVAGWLYE